MAEETKTLAIETVNTAMFPWYNRLKTKVQTSDGPRYYDIPEDDFRKLHKIYSENPSSNPNITPLKFVCQVDNRIYAEWCMGEARHDWNSHRDYQGEGFTNHIREETHHELVRRNYKWSKELHRFEGLTPEQYESVRNDVLRGFIRYAVEFFEKNEEGWQKLVSIEEGRESLKKKRWETPFNEKVRWGYIPEGDSRNIRASLENYIERNVGVAV